MGYQSVVKLLKDYDSPWVDTTIYRQFVGIMFYFMHIDHIYVFLLVWFSYSFKILEKAIEKLQRELFCILRVLISMVSSIIAVRNHSRATLILIMVDTLKTKNLVLAMCFH